MIRELASCRDVGVQVDGKWLIKNIDCSVVAGSITALVGPNGAGKSTLLGVLAGDRKPDAGEVRLAAEVTASWTSNQRAQLRSVMTQEQRLTFGFSVTEIVDLGRLPHRTDPARDPAIVTSAMLTADLEDLADRDVTTLSGGEAARVAFARTLAQTAPVVLLDEPTAALDLRHQEGLVAACRVLRQAGCAVVAVLHDLNLAARVADTVLMLAGGRIVAQGSVGEVFTEPQIAEVYGQAVRVIPAPDGHLVIVAVSSDSGAVAPLPAWSQRVGADLPTPKG